MSRPSMKWVVLVTSTLTAFICFSLVFVSFAQAGQASFPDLVVSSITNPPASAIAGTSFSVTDTTGNSGTATADPSTTKYHLSLDATITTSDPLLTGSRSVPTLKKGSSSSGSATVTIPSNQTPGTYYLGACADDASVITESNETNNCRASTTTVVLSPPASISNLSPSSGPRGLPVTINGSNFGATQGTSTVTFNGNIATPTNWSATAITVPVPSSATTGSVVVTVGGVASNGVTFTVTYAPRVNAGGGAYTDGSQNSWAADQTYSVSNIWGNTGGSTFSTTNPIANTTDDVLYQSERFGNLGYKFDLPNGRYNVTLHFAEIYSGTSGPNQRIFNVLIEGTPVLTNYDIAAEVGFETAVTKSFPGILVQDGQLNIDFTTVVGNAKISAIQVLPDQPAKLGFGAINGGNPPIAGGPFDVIVQSQDSFGNPVNVASATGVSVSLQSGTGVLTPTTLTGTIAAGTSQVTLTNASYSKAENGVVLRASRTSGDNLTTGDSAPFVVVAGGPTKLGFITQPGNTTAGNALPGPPVVAVQDSLGNTVTSSTAQITVAIGNNPGGGTLTGTAQKNVVAGTGIFADLSINQPASGYTLTASSGSLTPITSAAFNLAAGGTVSGTVTRTGTGAAIGGASVEALQSGVLKRTATTNGSGSYSMPGLAVGTYDVRVNASGYVSQTQNGLVVSAGGTTTANFSLTATTPTAGIVYIYDELQRLKSVIDPVGEAATYAYDAVGNLLSITRNSSLQTSVIDFNPNGGPVGAGVTIYGTGYSATPSQNSVTFNGVAASVVSSTLTQIVTTVPVGATNGPIAVTSPAGGATSATAFTVTGAPAGAPTIANFTPNLGTTGTAITITGTNFSATPANNDVRFNPTLAVVSNSSATSITTNFPLAGQSGKISVSTSGGSALSSQDFFAVPAPYVASDVEMTGRIVTGGSSQPVTINGANKIALTIFDGVAGQKLNLGITANTFPGGNNPTVNIYKPDRTLLLTRLVNATNSAIDFNVPIQGTYTIVVDPAGTNPGSLTLTLSAELNAGSVSINGAAVPVTIARPGQRAFLTFNGSAGQNISIAVTDSTFGGGGLCCPLFFYVYKPDGTLLGNHGVNDVFAVVDHSLPQSGTYTILVDPTDAVTGSLTFTLSEDINFGSLSINGPPTTVTTSRPGQRSFVTFNGSAAQSVTFVATNITIGSPGGLCCPVQLLIYKPDGSPLSNPGLNETNNAVDYLLTASGTHKIIIDPAGIATGSLTLRLYDDVNAGSVAINGAPTTVTISDPGRRAFVTFAGTAGQNLSVASTANTFGGGGFCCSTNHLIYKQDGTFFTSQGVTQPDQAYDRKLPETGTYKLLIDPAALATGSVTLTLSEDADFGSISTGQSVPITISRLGQRARLTFSGTQGNGMTLQMSSVTISSSVVSILKPDGVTNVASTSVGTSGALLLTNPLPETGTYTILIDPSAVLTGNMTLTLGTMMNLTMTYSGKIGDRVGQGDAALSADGNLDGIFNVTLPVGSGNRTVTSLDLQRTGGSRWDTTPNGFWALGAASSLDAALYNAPNATVNFPVADGGSFNIFASDSGGSLFNSGATFTHTVGFDDGSYGRGFVTLP